MLLIRYFAMSVGDKQHSGFTETHDTSSYQDFPNHNAAPSGSISFRVRGGPSTMSSQDQWVSTAHNEMDEEEKLRQELKRAKVLSTSYLSLRLISFSMRLYIMFIEKG